ncbi:ABC transporter permease [Paenibacillus thailandensis]|uniref:ABC transporter permease n=1 Tax=Paenibacillus thailandensis TaxID=393250 RepID=A0ABW5QV23_9BACL
MSLIDLTLRNVKRNFRLYAIYLLSMIIGVVIFYTFSSLMYNEDITEALSNRRNFQLGIMIASAAVFLFILFFILYANSFFMRQRKKEFGMYLLFGMNEWQITRIVFYESLALGGISLVVGILLGGLLSKLFGMLLMSLMRYDQVISLNFPVQALAVTVSIFAFLILIITVQSHLSVKRVQLIELFHAGSKMEKPVQTSRLLALVAVFMLVVSFVIIGGGKTSVFWTDYSTASLLAVAVGIIGGTYLFFSQFVGWLLETIRSKPNYAVGDTVLWASSLRFQTRGNTLNLTFISLFSALIVLFVSFTAINYAVQFEAVGRNLPNDLAHQSLDEETNKRIERIIGESGHDVLSHNTLEAVQAETVTDMAEAFDNPEFYSPGVLLVSETSYNEVVADRGDDRKLQLQADEAVSLSQGTDYEVSYNPAAASDYEIRTGGSAIRFKLAGKLDYALLGWSSSPDTSMERRQGALVIDDEAYAAIAAASPAALKKFEIYRLADADQAESLSRQVHPIVTAVPGAYYSSFADVYALQIESSSLLLFSSAFLALIALFALASVIYFKQLREATDERRQYDILGKMGVGAKLMRRVIRKQLMFVFAPPLAIGILISSFTIKVYILDSISNFPGLPGLVWWIVAAYMLIYAMFYLSAANLYYRIASQKP